MPITQRSIRSFIRMRSISSVHSARVIPYAPERGSASGRPLCGNSSQCSRFVYGDVARLVALDDVLRFRLRCMPLVAFEDNLGSDFLLDDSRHTARFGIPRHTVTPLKRLVHTVVLQVSVLFTEAVREWRPGRQRGRSRSGLLR